MNNYICLRCTRRLLSTSIARPKHNTQYRLNSLFYNGASRQYSVVQNTRGPLKLAVIGSGPAGFYTSYRVLSKLQDAQIDMYEKLPVPYGLVRYGVAPDHPEVKNCEDKFEEVAQSPRFNFIGNVSVGHEIPLQTLRNHYDGILLAYGAAEDRTLNIPGEDLRDVYSARAFVGWYNGLPEYAGLNPDLTAGEDVVIVGQGNVALDVARVLLSGVDRLKGTDMADHALETLAGSRVKRVRVVGRRGVVQAAFTIKELRELLTLPSATFEPLSASLIPTDTEIKTLDRPQKRIAQLLQKYSTPSSSPQPKSWTLDFLLSPTSFNADFGRLSSTTFTKNTYTSDTNALDRNARVTTTDETLMLPSAIAFRSVGYKSLPLPGLDSLGITFDNRLGIIPNDLHGRILAPQGSDMSDLMAKALSGLYCAGWVKRGPTGVIASTMDDAFNTGDVVVNDWVSNVPFLNREDKGREGWEAVKRDLKGVSWTDWTDWKRIDETEKRRGKEMGKERSKIVNVGEMLRILGKA